MARSTFALVVLCLAAFSSGCRMCASPYDYCGPTFTADGCQQCLPDFREGSVFSQAVPSAVDSEIVPGTILPVPDAEMVGPIPAIEQADQPVVAVRPPQPTVAAPRRTR